MAGSVTVSTLRSIQKVNALEGAGQTQTATGSWGLLEPVQAGLFCSGRVGLCRVRRPSACAGHGYDLLDLGDQLRLLIVENGAAGVEQVTLIRDQVAVLIQPLSGADQQLGGVGGRTTRLSQVGHPLTLRGFDQTS